MKDEILEKARRFIDNAAFDPVEIEKESQYIAQLCRWCIATLQFAKAFQSVSKNISPDKAKKMKLHQETLDGFLLKAASNLDFAKVAYMLNKGADAKTVITTNVTTFYSGDTQTCLSEALTSFSKTKITEDS